MIRAVIFDVGGVLLTLGINQYLEVLARELGSDQVAGVYRRWGERLERGEVHEVDLWRQVSGRICPEVAIDHVMTASFPPIPVMIDFAAELRARGVQTAILSNTVPSHVRAMGFLDGFDPIAMSCAIGARKPEREAFQYVLDRLGLPPDEVAYIDDSAENVAAGRALGLKALWHDGNVERTRRLILGWLKARVSRS